ncbi:RICIN domain-containing protein [Glycomyces buryatensis]|uniref:Uncharacterized protein n=1 Tax=Glycomyces buryatensis TaxID=2570927 RepID=A0A4V4HS25_9ACTN|nr:RICIN domain-containing protein [Glycomyces buryatensis]THV40136.1 hypothetical protein FAB82_15675 [Glycomyces buryatensis]
MTQQDQRPQRDLPDKIQSSWEGMRDKFGANRAVAVTAAVVAGVLLIAVVAAVVASGGGDEDGGTEQVATDESSAAEASASEEAAAGDDAQTAPSLPADGNYLMRQEAGGLCVTAGPEPGNEERTVMVLGDCAETYPVSLAFAGQGEGRYTVGLDFAEDQWEACLGADNPADEAGYLTSGYDCDGSELQSFTLSDLGSGVYAVAVAATGLCLGLLEDASAEAGAALATAACDPEDANQRFSLLVP